ncbi:MAG TPA: efflux RND transporter periplasmic adaptor subunit [Woeseiaceae bacterium]|nr:efflux RND transporter periplasmic adaptor subunit [Woeseiaceae bacterium]
MLKVLLRSSEGDDRIIVLAASGLLLTALASCGAEEAPSTPEPRLVRTMVVDDVSNIQLSQYTAEIRSRYETDLSFQVSGKIARRAVDVGTLVKRGDVLATLDSTDQQLGLDAAKSAVNAAQAELDRAQSEEARYRDLLERGLTTRAAYLTQQTAVKTSQSRVEQATADLRLSEQRLSYTTLRSDHDGVVTEVMAEAGSVVAAGQPVMNVARPSELEAVFDVPDSRIDALRSNSELQIAALGDSDVTISARIREISPSADPITRTYQVRASIPEPPPNLRLGMTVTVTLPRGEGTSSIRLPATALFQSGSDPAIWVVRSDYTLELRPVMIDRYESDGVLIASGLRAGDRVVTAGVHRLASNEKVRLLDEVQP